MNRIDAIFQAKREAGQKCLMPFICAGRPDVASMAPLLFALERSGASIVEIGFPFSDPIADGPVIAAAMHEALQSNVTPGQIFEGVQAARADGLALGLVAMVTVSIVERIGEKRFIEQAKDAGFDGFIFPDAPIDEAESLLRLSAEHGLTATMLISPTTPDDRAARIAKACTGFAYLLARVGITGERESAPEIEQHVARLRKSTDLPIACGFGLGAPDQVRAVVEHADAAIVGSALVRRIEDAVKDGTDAIKCAERFVSDLATGLRPAAGA